MIATFKETIRSLRDLKYGEKIVKRTVGESLWYWTKYLLLFSVIGLVLSIGAIVYFVPQLSGIVEKNVPDVEISIKDGLVETNIPQPFIEGSPEFITIINTEGKIEDLDDFSSGLLLLEDKLAVKSDNQVRIFELKEFEGLSFNKEIALGWINNNQGVLVAVGVVIAFFAIGLTAGIFWFGRLVSFFIWAALVWLGGKLLNKSLNYTDALKVTIYASVLPFILSILSSAYPNRAMSWLIMVVFLFYSFAWINNLPSKSK